MTAATSRHCSILATSQASRAARELQPWRRRAQWGQQLCGCMPHNSARHPPIAAQPACTVHTSGVLLSSIMCLAMDSQSLRLRASSPEGCRAMLAASSESKLSARDTASSHMPTCRAEAQAKGAPRVDAGQQAGPHAAGRYRSCLPHADRQGRNSRDGRSKRRE